MASNYRIVHTGVGPWRKGAVVSEQHIHDLQGTIDKESDKSRSQRLADSVTRLVDLGAVEPTADEVKIDNLDGTRSPEHTKGDNVDPGSDDSVEKRAERRAATTGARADAADSGTKAAVTKKPEPAK